MKKDLTDLAILGGKKSFSKVLPFGQFNFPQWERIEAMCEGIFDRHYFTNHAVLAQALEEKLCSYLGVRNAVTLTNESISMIYTATALGLTGKVIVPSVSPLSTIQPLAWYGLVPEFCDVDNETFLLTADVVRPILERQPISAIVASHLWGQVCDSQEIECLAREYDIPVIYDATHAFGCGDNNKMVGAAGAAEVFSFNADYILNAGEGGVVATDDDDIAEQLRNLRSNYGRLKTVEIPLNGNGRFSEFQAGLALLSFEDLDKNIASNRERKLRYAERLKSISGIDVLFEENSSICNHQWVVVSVNEKEFGLGSRILMDVLCAENVCVERPRTSGSYQFPPYNRFDMPVFPIAEAIAGNVLLLPTGEAVTLESVDLICSIILSVQENSKKIKKRLNDD